MRKQTSQHDKDFYGWALSQADLLKQGDYQKVDWENVIEEMELLGGSERSKLESYLENLLMHMLKKQFQPDMHTRSWDLSIKQARLKVVKTLKKNPSLKHKLDETFSDAYEIARLGAAKETGLQEKLFPKTCPGQLTKLFE